MDSFVPCNDTDEQRLAISPYVMARYPATGRIGYQVRTFRSHAAAEHHQLVRRGLSVSRPRTQLLR